MTVFLDEANAKVDAAWAAYEKVQATFADIWDAAWYEADAASDAAWIAACSETKAKVDAARDSLNDAWDAYYLAKEGLNHDYFFRRG